MIQLGEIVEYLDALLGVDAVPDDPSAHNGLQVENRSPIEKVGAAVDACLRTIELAASADCGLLLVHHGLFWGDPLPVTGMTYRRLRALWEADLALYSAHLPLDVHEEVGNNVRLAEALGLEVEGRFGHHRDVEGIGVWGTADVPRRELVRRIEAACGVPPRVIEGGPAHVRRVGIITGGGGSLIRQAATEGLDTFVTGEGSHHTFHEATELGLNLIYAGHYATETFGVVALAERVAERFGIDWTFLDLPTGL